MSKVNKKYKTILADPPWDINQKGNYGAVHHYNLMTLDQIKAMPVSDLGHDEFLSVEVDDYVLGIHSFFPFCAFAH